MESKLDQQRAAEMGQAALTEKQQKLADERAAELEAVRRHPFRLGSLEPENGRHVRTGPREGGGVEAAAGGE